MHSSRPGAGPIPKLSSTIHSVLIRVTRSSVQGVASHRAEQMAKPADGRGLTFTNLEELEDLAKPPLLPDAVGFSQELRLTVDLQH